MRLTVIAAAVLAAATSIPATGATAPEGGKVDFKWNTEVHDFGTFNEDVGRVKCLFKGVNLGPDTASVIYLNASCGCTEPVADKRVIAPGDTVTLTVVYDPVNRPGPFDKRISFGTLPGYRVNLHIKGNVVRSTRRMLITYPYEVGGDFRLGSDVVSFGNIREDRTANAVVKGINSSDAEVTPTVVAMPPYVKATVTPPVVKPGEHFVISFDAEGPGVGQLGVTLDTITVASAGHPDVSIDLPMSILLFEEFPPMTADDVDRAAYLEIPDPKVDLGEAVDPSSRKPIRRKVKVVNKGLEPLLIRRAYTVTPGIKVKAPHKAIGPGKTAEIEIEVIPALLPKESDNTIRARVSVISNTPLNTTMDITVTGKMK